MCLWCFCSWRTVANLISSNYSCRGLARPRAIAFSYLTSSGPYLFSPQPYFLLSRMSFPSCSLVYFPSCDCCKLLLQSAKGNFPALEAWISSLIPGPFASNPNLTETPPLTSHPKLHSSSVPHPILLLSCGFRLLLSSPGYCISVWFSAFFPTRQGKWFLLFNSLRFFDQ